MKLTAVVLTNQMQESLCLGTLTGFKAVSWEVIAEATEEDEYVRNITEAAEDEGLTALIQILTWNDKLFVPCENNITMYQTVL